MSIEELVEISHEYNNMIANDKRLTTIASKQIVLALMHDTMALALAKYKL